MTSERKWESQSHHERKPERNRTARSAAVKLGDMCLSQFWFLSVYAQQWDCWVVWQSFSRFLRNLYNSQDMEAT